MGRAPPPVLHISQWLRFSPGLTVKSIRETSFAFVLTSKIAGERFSRNALATSVLARNACDRPTQCQSQQGSRSCERAVFVILPTRRRRQVGQVMRQRSASYGMRTNPRRGSYDASWTEQSPLRESGICIPRRDRRLKLLSLPA